MSSAVGDQTSGTSQRGWNLIFVSWLVAVVALILGQIYLYPSVDKVVLWHQGDSAQSGTELVTEPFELKGDLTNVEVFFTGPSYANYWMEMEGFLRDRKTNKTYSFSNSIEYYSGYEGGERWTEGSRKDKYVINLVPAGEYEVVAQIYQSKEHMPYEFFISRDVPILTNLWIVLVLITLPIGYYYFMSNSFRNRQWADSDYK